MFRKLKERLLTMEVVLEAIIELLSKRDILTREEIQLEILAQAGETEFLPDRCELHELPRHKDIKIYGFEISGEDDAVIIFNHIDGRYSHCHVQGNPDKVVHLSATTPLVKYKDGYKLEEEE